MRVCGLMQKLLWPSPLAMVRSQLGARKEAGASSLCWSWTVMLMAGACGSASMHSSGQELCTCCCSTGVSLVGCMGFPSGVSVHCLLRLSAHCFVFCDDHGVCAPWLVLRSVGWQGSRAWKGFRWLPCFQAWSVCVP
jgi:hypothetical protein